MLHKVDSPVFIDHHRLNNIQEDKSLFKTNISLSGGDSRQRLVSRARAKFSDCQSSAWSVYVCWAASTTIHTTGLPSARERRPQSIQISACQPQPFYLGRPLGWIFEMSKDNQKISRTKSYFAVLVEGWPTNRGLIAIALENGGRENAVWSCLF